MHLLKKYGLFEKRCLKIKYLFLFPLCRFKDRFSLINYCASLINSWSVSSIIVFDIDIAIFIASNRAEWGLKKGGFSRHGERFARPLGEPYYLYMGNSVPDFISY